MVQSHRSRRAARQIPSRPSLRPRNIAFLVGLVWTALSVVYLLTLL